MPRTMTPGMRKAMFARIQSMRKGGPFRAALGANVRKTASGVAGGIAGGAVGMAAGIGLGHAAIGSLVGGSILTAKFGMGSGRLSRVVNAVGNVLAKPAAVMANHGVTVNHLREAGGFVGSVTGALAARHFSAKKSTRFGKAAFKNPRDLRRYNWTRTADVAGYGAARLMEKLGR